MSTSSSETTSSGRGARVAVALVALIFLALQPLSTPVAHHFIRSVQHDTATYLEWERYLAEPHAPNILFIGDSRAREDVDAGRIQRLLSEQTGRRRSIATLGINAEQPVFLEALTYRLMARSSRPSVVVYQFSEYQFSTRYVFDPTADFWQISAPFDAEYVWRAVNLDPNRGRLLRGWLLPLFANLPAIVSGLRCQLQPSLDPYGCNIVPADPEGRRQYFANRFDQYLRDYQFSELQAAAVREAVQLARAHGVTVAFAILPAEDLQAAYPEAYRIFLTGAQGLASSLQVPLWDLHGQLQGRPDLFNDPNHLNGAGAAAIAPLLTEHLRAIGD